MASMITLYSERSIQEAFDFCNDDFSASIPLAKAESEAQD